jgi:hypothetical protein
VSWLAANWYSVLAIFSFPAIAGIGFWIIAHRVISQREREDRDREARKLRDFQLWQFARRRPGDEATAARQRSPW